MTTEGCTCFQRPRVAGSETCCTRCGCRLLAWVTEAAADDALDVGALTTDQILERRHRAGERVVLAAVSPDLGRWFRRRSWHVAAARVQDALAGARL